MKNILCLSAVVGLVMSVQARGDTLVTRTKEYKGTFEGYEKNMFAFRAAGGEILKEDRSQVTQLDLDKPCKVAVLLAREKEAENTQFVEYKTLKFVFRNGRKDKTVFANHVKEIVVDRPPPPMGAGGGAPGQGDVVIPPLNIAAVEGNPDLTVAQSAVIARYKEARKKYENFLSESSALVAQMDAARGANREKFLNELRLRKSEEQPIKRDLEAAMAAVHAAFPKTP